MQYVIEGVDEKGRSCRRCIDVASEREALAAVKLEGIFATSVRPANSAEIPNADMVKLDATHDSQTPREAVTKRQPAKLSPNTSGLSFIIDAAVAVLTTVIQHPFITLLLVVLFIPVFAPCVPSADSTSSRSSSDGTPATDSSGLYPGKSCVVKAVVFGARSQVDLEKSINLYQSDRDEVKAMVSRGELIPIGGGTRAVVVTSSPYSTSAKVRLELSGEEYWVSVAWLE